MDEADEDPSDDEDEAQPPEQVVGLVLEALIAQELELRKGQANDALEKLRLALAHTSLLWQTKVQMPNTTRNKLRLGKTSGLPDSGSQNMSNVIIGLGMP